MQTRYADLKENFGAAGDNGILIALRLEYTKTVHNMLLHNFCFVFFYISIEYAVTHKHLYSVRT